MAIFQPTNIIPSTFSGLTNSVVDVNNEVNISWQVNGNSPMTRYKIDIFQNNAASTPVYSGAITTLQQPFYPVDNKGNPQIFTPSFPSGQTWSSMTNGAMVNGQTYKFKITQYWDSGSVEQYSDSVFITRTTPTLSVSIQGNDQIDAIFETFVATYTQAQNDAINWVRWQLYSVATETGAEVLLEDTGVVNTNVLSFFYDGFLPQEENLDYKIVCTIQTASGAIISVSKQYAVMYSYQESGDNSLSLCCKNDGSVLLSFREALDIPGKPQSSGGASPTVDQAKQRLNLPTGTSVLWDTVNDEPMSFESPLTVGIKTDVDLTVGTYITDLQTTETHSATAYANDVNISSIANGNLPTNNAWRSVTYGNGMYIALAYQTNQIASSPDGINWTSGTLPTQSSSLSYLTVKHCGNYFFALGYTEFCVKSDTDTVWTKKTGYGIDGLITDVAYGNGTYVMVSPAGGIYYSTDGTQTWQKSTATQTESFAPAYIIFHDGYFYVSTGRGKIRYSPTAQSNTWTNLTISSVTIDTNGSYKLFSAQNKLFLYNSATALSYYARNPQIGSDWQSFSYTINTVAYGNDCYTDIKTDGKIYQSMDGVSWEQKGQLSTPYWGALTYGENNTFVTTSGTSYNTAKASAAIKHSFLLLSALTNIPFTQGEITAIRDVSIDPSTANVPYLEISTNKDGYSFVVEYYSLTAEQKDIFVDFEITYKGNAPYSIYPEITMLGINNFSVSLVQSQSYQNPSRYAVRIVNSATTDSIESGVLPLYIESGVASIIVLANEASVYITVLGKNNFVLYWETQANTIGVGGVSEIQVYGTQSVDWVYVASGNISLTDIQNLDYKPQWTDSTEMLANFRYDMQGGTVSSPSSFNAIYKLTNGQMERLYNLPLLYNKMKDYSVVRDNTYQYRLYFVNEQNAYMNETNSEEISVKTNKFFLYETQEDNENANLFHVLNTWVFGNNINGGTYSNNNTPSWQQNFTRYPLKQPNSQLYQSGTLTALLSNVKDCVYADTAEQMQRLSNLSASLNTFFLKDTKGNLFMVGIGGAITQTINTKSGVQEVTISIPWKEIGDTSDVSIISVPTDEGWTE